ncbi:MAG: SIR2 family protein [Tistlia sp.]|uniref:SIR2 family protein n=1 Tax=Tistlia sp. TaxID=3057121 RepID=UPI0034A23B4A
MADETRTITLDYQLLGPSEDGTVSDLLSELSSPTEGHQRLQALIAEWLQMENLVVLTGAGCSFSAGGKLMTGLEAAVLEAVLQVPDLPKSIATVVDHRLAPPSPTASRYGFESWLSFVANAHFLAASHTGPIESVTWRGGVIPTAAELKWLLDHIGAAVFAECALPLTQLGDNPPAHVPFLAKLVARDSNLGRAHLFTLNYDTLFEQALEVLGIQYFDGFTGRANGRFDPSVYGLDIYYPGEVAEGRVRRFDKFLHFYKLHGSIHWQVRDDEILARHPDLSETEHYQNMKTAEKAVLLSQMTATLPPVGILPTANKLSQTLAMPFSHLFRSLQIRLSVPQTFLLVLGYGFGDDHVTRIIESALMNPSLVMLVVEPDPFSDTIRRVREYRELGKRAFVLAPSTAAFASKPFQVATFDDFSRSVMPDVQWLDDFLRLRRFEKQIQKSTSASANEMARQFTSKSVED